MTKKIAIFALVTSAALGYCYWHFKKQPAPAATPSATFRPQDLNRSQTQDFIQRQGEEFYKKQYYRSQIAVYERMLQQFPDSPDTQKKLAFAYYGAGEFEKARPLLERIAKGPEPDPRVLDLLKKLR